MLPIFLVKLFGFSSLLNFGLTGETLAIFFIMLSQFESKRQANISRFDVSSLWLGSNSLWLLGF